jgi:hypothetical protein
MKRAALLLAVPILLAACGGTSTPRAQEQTAPAAKPTPKPTCAKFSGATGAQSAAKPAQTMLLTGVKADSDSCTDRIVFDFRDAGGAAPGATVAYRPADQAQTEDASGRHIPIAGKSFLVVRFEPAATADLSKPELEITYTGPRSIKPAGARWVQEIAKTGDFEAVLTWSIGLSEQRPFTVQTEPGRLTVVFG